MCVEGGGITWARKGFTEYIQWRTPREDRMVRKEVSVGEGGKQEGRKGKGIGDSGKCMTESSGQMQVRPTVSASTSSCDSSSSFWNASAALGV